MKARHFKWVRQELSKVTAENAKQRRDSYHSTGQWCWEKGYKEDHDAHAYLVALIDDQFLNAKA